jgi:hypothetical protein
MMIGKWQEAKKGKDKKGELKVDAADGVLITGSLGNVSETYSALTKFLSADTRNK